jgi:glyoxylase-like metal-dependent hydrolase (beta-lactamase superfamily II)
MNVTPIIASTFATDGGTMFGLVPKPIWSRLVEADEKNRVGQHAHVLLVELDDGRKGLIDTGCGPADKFSEREAELHGLGPGWPLLERLKSLSVSPAEISFVIFSHLHWDHAGGASPGHGALTFPNAVHYVHQHEWTDATSGDPLLYKSYPTETIAPLRDLPDDQLHLIQKDREQILPGITMVRSGGHTRGHCVIELESKDGIELDHPEKMFMFAPRKIIFAGDVCPTRHNLRMVFQTSYDTFPLDTRQWKRTALAEIARDGALIMFDHDTELFGSTIRPHDKREFVVEKTLHAALSEQSVKTLDDLELHGRFRYYREDPFISG